MLPFQYLFIAAAVMWGLSQMIPANHIQIKMQSTSALIMMMIGMTITGVITIPQFEPENNTARIKPMDTFGPDDLDRDIKRLGKY
jgi:heme A synthase